MIFDGYDMVLIGIGEEFSEAPDALKAYNKLSEDLKGKNYFIVSLCMDDIIYESNLDSDRIVSPLGGKRKKQCPDACENALYDIDKETCPICGKPIKDYLTRTIGYFSMVSNWTNSKRENDFEKRDLTVTECLKVS